jgi:hypothetical protein
MPSPNNSNHSKLQEDALKLQKIYLRASSWIRDMSAPRTPARLRPNCGPHAAAGGGPRAAAGGGPRAAAGGGYSK